MSDILNKNTRYIESWLCSKKTVQPLIIASHSLDILNDVITKTTELNKNKDTLFLKEDGGSFKIKETRELLGEIARTSYSRQRLVIIPLAEKLTPPAGNALLKSLEEPSVHNRWLITTRQLPLLLPTIRSRCQILRVNKAAAPNMADNDSLLKELNISKKENTISAEALCNLHDYLTSRLRTQGPNIYIFRALLRLRDYHKIKCYRGNTKLARDVLLASLYQLRNN